MSPPITQPSSFYSLLQTLMAGHAGLIANVIPFDREGMRIYPVKGTTPSALAAAIAADLAANLWICTSTHKDNVLIEFEQTRRLSWPESNYHYHVSNIANHASILANGIQLGTGGNTAFNRSYPPRIYVARNLLTAIEFVQFQCKDKWQAMPHALLNAAGITVKARNQLEIWRVWLPDGTPVHNDVLFPGVAGYVVDPIPSANVQLVTTWQAYENQLDQDRKNGVV